MLVQLGGNPERYVVHNRTLQDLTNDVFFHVGSAYSRLTLGGYINRGGMVGLGSVLMPPTCQ